MASFRVLLGEKDGEEFSMPVEFDLLQALLLLGVGAIDFDKILTDNFFDVLVDNDGNVIVEG